MNYWTFVRQYEAHIAKKVCNDEARLLLFPQHCIPRVRSKIDHLTAKTPDHGFRLAWEIRFEEYSRSNEIAHFFEERRRCAPKINDNDREGLKQPTVHFFNISVSPHF